MAGEETFQEGLFRVFEKRGEDSRKPKKTGKKCSACKTGEIVEAINYIRSPYAGPERIGNRESPEASLDYMRVPELYCENCGVKYKFLPKD